MQTKISINSLQEKSGDVLLNEIKGGYSSHCSCACAYQNQGGSSTCENSEANYRKGWHSPGYDSGCSQGSTLVEHQFFMNCI